MAAAADSGVSTLQLMEIAGCRSRDAHAPTSVAPPTWALLAGYGNNGGDGAGCGAAPRDLGMYGAGARPCRGRARVRVVVDHVISARRCGVDVVVNAIPDGRPRCQWLGPILSLRHLGNRAAQRAARAPGSGIRAIK